MCELALNRNYLIKLIKSDNQCVHVLSVYNNSDNSFIGSIMAESKQSLIIHAANFMRLPAAEKAHLEAFLRDH